MSRVVVRSSDRFVHENVIEKPALYTAVRGYASVTRFTTHVVRMSAIRITFYSRYTRVRTEFRIPKMTWKYFCTNITPHVVFSTSLQYVPNHSIARVLVDTHVNNVDVTRNLVHIRTCIYIWNSLGEYVSNEITLSNNDYNNSVYDDATIMESLCVYGISQSHDDCRSFAYVTFT